MIALTTNKHLGIRFRKTVSAVCVGVTLFSLGSPIIETYVFAETLIEGPTESSSLVSNSEVYKHKKTLSAASKEQTNATTSKPDKENSLSGGEETVLTASEEQEVEKESSKQSSTKDEDSSGTNKTLTEEENIIFHSESSEEDNKKLEEAQEQAKKEKQDDNRPIVYTRNLSTLEFIEEIGEQAREVGQKYDLYASVMIAQAILESGSGNSQLSSSPNNNLFGIKGKYQGNYVDMSTLEDDGKGGMFTISARFRKYPSTKASIEDYASLMKGGTSEQSSYYAGAFKSNTQNYREATNFLTGRYATDIRYYEKLNGLIETYELTKYDNKKAQKEIGKKEESTEKFIKSISKEVVKIGDKNDLYPSVIIAEAILKSNSGQNTLAKNHNLFEMTGEYNGKSVSMESFEKEKSQFILKNTKFKEYSSYEESISDYISDSKKDMDHYMEMTRKKKNNYRKVTAYLTAQNKDDRQYHKKLNKIIETYQLTKFDKSEASKANEKMNKKEKDKKLFMLNKVGNSLSKTLSESLKQPVKYEIGES